MTPRAPRSVLGRQFFVACIALFLGPSCTRNESAPQRAALRLSETGLYADFAKRSLAEGVSSYTPQYPLWSDGAAKRRWFYLPKGSVIQGADPDHWVFPVGTRFWKEFRFERAVETRYMEKRTDDTWLYATYRWNDDAREALLAPEAGVRRVCASREGQHHDLPSIADCRACHEGSRTPILGFSALQLSSDRDPLAPHAEDPAPEDLDLRDLIERGLLVGFADASRTPAPRIGARSATERAALGYLHSNCGNCHNNSGPLQRLELRLDYPLGADVAPGIATTVGVASHFRRANLNQRVVPGAPDESLMLHRVATRDPLSQMPPLGRHLIDATAAALLREWIERDLVAEGTNQPTNLLFRKPKSCAHSR